MLGEEKMVSIRIFNHSKSKRYNVFFHRILNDLTTDIHWKKVLQYKGIASKTLPTNSWKRYPYGTPPSMPPPPKKWEMRPFQLVMNRVMLLNITYSQLLSRSSLFFGLFFSRPWGIWSHRIHGAGIFTDPWIVDFYYVNEVGKIYHTWILWGCVKPKYKTTTDLWQTTLKKPQCFLSLIIDIV